MGCCATPHYRRRSREPRSWRVLLSSNMTSRKLACVNARTGREQNNRNVCPRATEQRNNNTHQSCPLGWLQRDIDWCFLRKLWAIRVSLPTNFEFRHTAGVGVLGLARHPSSSSSQDVGCRCQNVSTRPCSTRNQPRKREVFVSALSVFEIIPELGLINPLVSSLCLPAEIPVEMLSSKTRQG
jgi:hypothetical protein